jgi:hypothetical protein
MDGARIAALVLSTVACVACSPQAAGPLPRLNILPGSLSVSGIPPSGTEAIAPDDFCELPSEAGDVRRGRCSQAIGAVDQVAVLTITLVTGHLLQETVRYALEEVGVQDHGVTSLGENFTP